MISNNKFLSMFNSPVRKLMGRVEVYQGSTLTLVCGCHDRLREFTVERVGEGKFFGYGVCHKLNVKLLDRDRDLSITTANSLEIEFGIGTEYLYPFPKFYVTQVYRDEVTNELSITAYDRLYQAAEHTAAELNLPSSYTIGNVATACGKLLGLPVNTNGIAAFTTNYPNGANFEGTETVREVLNAIAEATQTIYFINWDWVLTFVRLDQPQALLIDKSKYFDLDNGDNRRLAKITHATELGDNVTASTLATGTTQYVRDNPFWELREDIDSLVNDALAAVGGLTINQFSCSWRGNPLLEIGDHIGLESKDSSIISSYLLNDTLTFNGALSQNTEWQYDANEEETAENPTSLGDALRQTYARVNKANKEITLVASKTEANTEAISSLWITTEGVSASVQAVENATSAAIENTNNELALLTSRVNASISAEDVQLQIERELANGVNSVTTTTGFTFNETGLTVSKSGSEINTTISENGMTVYRNSEAVLSADNEGVKAEDLHAVTYLIIGTNSRLENYGFGRTGCFWIGG